MRVFAFVLIFAIDNNHPYWISSLFCLCPLRLSCFPLTIVQMFICIEFKIKLFWVFGFLYFLSFCLFVPFIFSHIFRRFYVFDLWYLLQHNYFRLYFDFFIRSFSVIFYSVLWQLLGSWVAVIESLISTNQFKASELNIKPLELVDPSFIINPHTHTSTTLTRKKQLPNSIFMQCTKTFHQIRRLV